MQPLRFLPLAALSFGAFYIYACGAGDPVVSAGTDDTDGAAPVVQQPAADSGPKPSPPALGSDAAAEAGVPQLPGYTLAFHDEFDALDLAVWDYDLAVINGEAQCYTDARAENVRIEERGARSVLVLQTRKEDYPCPQSGGAVSKYTSGGLHTRHRDGQLLRDFSFGHYEIAAKLPAGKGTWPAIWLLGQTTAYGWPKAGEIDIMEVVGYEEASGVFASHATLHRTKDRPWPTEIDATGMGHTLILPSATSADFHVWSLDWTPSTLAFAVDGTPVTTRGIDYQGKTEEHATFDRADIRNSDDDLGWPFARGAAGAEFEMILNLAFGGNWGGLRGLDDTIFEAGKPSVEMLVDYVRVYTKNP